MKNTLLAAKDPEGVGLAAPQIGKSLQIFIIKPTLSAPITVLINPHVTLLEEDIPHSAKASRGKPLVTFCRGSNSVTLPKLYA